MNRVLVAAAVAALGGSWAIPSAAGEAQCFTTDDGHYPCWFEPGPDGDFTITGGGRPSYSVDVIRPGIAWARAVFPNDGRSVTLPGPYYRSNRDRACWDNPRTGAQICAW